MPTRYGRSPWIDRFPKSRIPDYPKHRGPLNIDVAIVGGGLTGCATAYAFAAAGIKVVLVEAARIAQQGSGRGPGVLKGEAGARYRDVELRHGRKAARSIFEESQTTITCRARSTICRSVWASISS